MDVETLILLFCDIDRAITIYLYIHLYRGGIHLNEEGQQKLTSAMTEVLNNHSANGQCFPIRTIITRT